MDVQKVRGKIDTWYWSRNRENKEMLIKVNRETINFAV